ncbi:MAG: beta-lactamase family protein [Saprospirales bacterium]|nr:beta-lactamase family protein [Saprospirales bacterium]
MFLVLALGISTQVTAPEMPVSSPLPIPVLPSAETLVAVRDFDDYIEQAIAQGLAPGAAVAIVQNGQTLLAKGYGRCSVLDPQTVNEHTIFRIASLSKSIAAFLTGRLVEKEVLNWNDPVDKYLPELCLKTDDQTQGLQLDHLLSHTTGLPYHTYTDQIEVGKTIPEIIPLLADIELIGKEGTVYSYQNAAFSLIGEVIGSATGCSYEENLDFEVFEPLGMTDASASLSAFRANPNAAMPHKANGIGIWKQLAPSPRYYNAAPAGGVNASAADMAKYMLAMLGNRPDLIADETLSELGKPRIYTPVRYRYFNNWENLKKVYYGLGWRVLDLGNGETLLYHGGYVAGYRSEILLSPKKGLGICVLFNGATDISDECIPRFLGSLPEAF